MRLLHFSTIILFRLSMMFLMMMMMFVVVAAVVVVAVVVVEVAVAVVGVLVDDFRQFPVQQHRLNLNYRMCVPVHP